MNNYLTIFRMVLAVLCLHVMAQLTAQSDQHPIAATVAAHEQQFQSLLSHPLLYPSSRQQAWGRSTQEEIGQAMFFELEERNVARLLAQPTQLLSLQLPTHQGQVLHLKLTRAEIFSDDFQFRLASDPKRTYPYRPGVYYWGVVQGETHSLAAIAIHHGEIMGTISVSGQAYTLGKLANTNQSTHVLYRKVDMKKPSPFNCSTDDDQHLIGREVDDYLPLEKSGSNCVSMYLEVDHDIVQQKGSVAAAADYISGAFSQVAMLYANESIDLVISEMLVWDVNDPYTGPATSDYLFQFRDRLNGNYNGDLAHLIGNKASGGIAYIDVLCNKKYGLGYSGISSYYEQVPTYSWTVEVIAHEIGHNLGSKHTHACAWNGDNTAIDGCGPAAGYSEGCDGPLPDRGTIMSYCHLISGVGTDFSLGFGPQPGNRIRSRISQADCLSSCTTAPAADAGITRVLTPAGETCTASLTPRVELTNFGPSELTSVDVHYRVDNGAGQTFAWTGKLAAGATTTFDLPIISYSTGEHSFHAETRLPNGGADANTANNTTTTTFHRLSSRTYYRDADGDGYGDPDRARSSCTPLTGYVTDASDCNDQDATAYPGAPCDDGDACTTNDQMDSNCRCRGTSNTSFRIFYADADGDGYGNPYRYTVDCAPPAGYVDNRNDCNDNDASAYPGAPCGSGDCADSEYMDDRCDCVESVASDTLRTYYADQDGDGFGDPNNSVEDCRQPAGFVQDSTDCQDQDAAAYPGAPCDDGDSCTIDDALDADCACLGILADTDGDGVCDGEDICPAGDDQLDEDGNGVPDACDGFQCMEEDTESFSASWISHYGGGSSTRELELPVGATDVSFMITDLNVRLDGREYHYYIDEATVTYVDGQGETHLAGVYRGDLLDTAEVKIPGEVRSVTVALADAYDGYTRRIQVVYLSKAGYCPASASEAISNPLDIHQRVLRPAAAVRLYPNPAGREAMLEFEQGPVTATVDVHDLLGRLIARYAVDSAAYLPLPVHRWPVSSQLYIITIQVSGQAPVVKRLLTTK